MIDLTNRVILLTGATGGIGTETARTLIKAGATVLLHDLNQEATKALAEELGKKAYPLAADLSDVQATDELWARALAVHRRIDVLINNAGVYPPAPIDADLADWLRVWDRSLAINLIAPAVLCRAAVTTFTAQPEGGIIIGSSYLSGVGLDRWWFTRPGGLRCAT